MRPISTVITVLMALCIAVLAAGAAHAQGNKQIMSERMATQDLKRNIVEAVIGYKLKGESEQGFTENAAYQVDTKAAAVIKGITVDKMIYDREKDVALCFGHIDLKNIVNVLGEEAKFKDVSVQGFGFGTMTEASRPPLRALRAALINAQDEMAALLTGEKISAQSRTENYLLTGDSNRAKVSAAVYGAYIPNPDLSDPKRGWGWDSSGNAFVTLEMDAHKVKDVLGESLVHKDENILRVTGHGAQKDEVSPDANGPSPSMVKDAGSPTRYENLSIPDSK